MSAMQRNNIARLPWEIREKVCRLRFDGRGNREIASAVQEACRAAAIAAPKIHGTSILAYSRSQEYRDYCDRRRQWDERMAPRRWAAAMVNEGRGPQSVADLAELEILEQLHQLAAGGLLETGRDVATVARAITTMQRTQLMRREEESDARVRALEQEHASALAAGQAQLAEAKAEIERLSAALRAAGLDPAAGGGAELTADKIANIRRHIGLG